MKRAFTLVEILVSMAIISALVGLGIVSLSQFRRTMEADQAGDAIMAGIKETKNLAKNNSVNGITSGSEMLNKNFAYKLTFEGNTVYRQLCSKGFTDPWGSPNCLGTKVDLKPSSFSNVLLAPQADSPCDIVYIENLTEKMYAFKSTVPTTEVTSPCKIDLVFKDNSEKYRTLVIKPANGNYSIN